MSDISKERDCEIIAAKVLNSWRCDEPVPWTSSPSAEDFLIHTKQFHDVVNAAVPKLRQSQTSSPQQNIDSVAPAILLQVLQDLQIGALEQDSAENTVFVPWSKMGKQKRIPPLKPGRGR